MYRPTTGVSAVSRTMKRAISIQPAAIRTAPAGGGPRRGSRARRSRRSARSCSYAVEPFQHEEEDREGERSERERRHVAERVQDGGEGHATDAGTAPVKAACRCAPSASRIREGGSRGAR